jgi:hypothetical protein
MGYEHVHLFGYKICIFDHACVFGWEDAKKWFICIYYYALVTKKIIIIIIIKVM